MKTIKLFIDAVITGIWCMLWVIPVFALYLAASILSHTILSTRQIIKDENKNKTDVPHIIE